MKCAAEVYSCSPRPYRGIPEPHYPFHDRTVVVTSCGRLCLYRKKINLSKSLAGQAVGVKEVEPVSGWSAPWIMIWGISTWRENLATSRQPVWPTGVTHVLGTICYLCIRNGHSERLASPGGFEPPLPP